MRKTDSAGCSSSSPRLSRRARTMPRKSPLTSVTSALSMAMSVPVPIAMPTSACASAGASLMPSPAMATRSTLLLKTPDHRWLSGPEAPRLRPGRCQRRSQRPVPSILLSPVSITTLMPSAMQVRRWLLVAVGFIGSATPMMPDSAPVDDDEHDRLSRSRAALRRARAGCRRRLRAIP